MLFYLFSFRFTCNYFGLVLGFGLGSWSVSGDDFFVERGRRGFIV